jgi:hypothetical protein
MASHEVQVRVEDRPGRGALAAGPELGEVKVSYLFPALAGRSVAGDPERLLASLVTLPPLVPFIFAGLPDGRPWLVPVLLPCPLLACTRACAPLLPDREGDRRPPGERARPVTRAAAQGDSGLRRVTGYGAADRNGGVPATPVGVTCAWAGSAERIEANSDICQHQALPPARA